VYVIEDINKFNERVRNDSQEEAIDKIGESGFLVERLALKC